MRSVLEGQVTAKRLIAELASRLVIKMSKWPGHWRVPAQKQRMEELPPYLLADLGLTNPHKRPGAGREAAVQELLRRERDLLQ